MKITLRQLKKIISEVVVASNDTKQKIEDLEDSIKKDNPDATGEEIDAAISKLTQAQLQEDLDE